MIAMAGRQLLISDLKDTGTLSSHASQIDDP